MILFITHINMLPTFLACFFFFFFFLKKKKKKKKKMKLRFSLFVLFVISTNSDLIPNDRVILDPDFSEDPNLVEGIIYKVAHLNSGSYLSKNENDRGIHVDSAFDSNQYWSIRKDNGNRY